MPGDRSRECPSSCYENVPLSSKYGNEPLIFASIPLRQSLALREKRDLSLNITFLQSDIAQLAQSLHQSRRHLTMLKCQKQLPKRSSRAESSVGLSLLMVCQKFRIDIVTLIMLLFLLLDPVWNFWPWRALIHCIGGPLFL